MMRNTLQAEAGKIPPKDVELTILAPMYNEARNVERTVSAIMETMETFEKSWELLFVNDGSTDDTLQVARQWEEEVENLRVLSYPVNSGRGKALRTGFDNVRGRYVITIDFDLSYSPDHIPGIYRELADAAQMNDVVLASAYMPGGQAIGVATSRLWISRLGNKVLRYAFSQRFNTTTCILRGYKREVLRALELESEGKEIHLEILSKVCALGFRVKEIPATLKTRKEGGSKFKLKRTAFTHILFSLFERPILVFGGVSLVLILAGLIVGAWIVWLRYQGTLSPDRPLIPLMVLLLVMGGQFFCFAFIATQNSALRNEVYRLQKQVRMMKHEGEVPDQAP